MLVLKTLGVAENSNTNLVSSSTMSTQNSLVKFTSGDEETISNQKRFNSAYTIIRLFGLINMKIIHYGMLKT